MEREWRKSPDRVRMQYGRGDGSIIVQDIIEPPGSKVTPSWASNMKIMGRYEAPRMAAYHALLKKKYEQAMRNPLQPLAPDPLP